jgi:hypothetical protein
MEIPGSSYLYALATVSITFVGFSALPMIFRQTMGSAVWAVMARHGLVPGAPK